MDSQNKKQLIPNNGENWIVEAGVAAVHGGGVQGLQTGQQNEYFKVT